ncbi:MAG: YitT family protein [Clostridia bacterium]|nr:YitT family protein [Clostridia bacterium]
MKKRGTHYLTIGLGAFLAAFSVRFFLLPFQISTGGVSGIATLLYYLFSVPVSLSTLLLNLTLLLFALRRLARANRKGNLLGIFLFSLFLKVTEPLPPCDCDLFLAAFFGGVVAGCGVGLTLSRDASTGGTDLAALMLSGAFPHRSPAFFINLLDTGIILASGLFFGRLSVTLYSLLSLFVSNFVVDRILVRGDAAKAVFVISRDSERIARRILSELGRGVTGLPIRGLYSRTSGQMLYCVVRPRQVPELLGLVEETDAEAFTVVTDAKKVQGRGFSFS